MSENPDTVTPMDGDGHNVVFPGGESEPSDDGSGNIDPESYETRGRTTVATRPGYAFQPSDKSLPVITREGVQMTADQAKAVVEEARTTRSGVHIVQAPDENEEE